MPFGARKNIGLFLGLIIFIIGLFGILSSLSVIGFKIPFTVNIIAWVLAAGGIYLVIESVTEIGLKRTLALGVALIALIISLFPILNQFGVIAFSVPGLGLLFYHTLLALEGVFLIINAFGT